MKSLIKLLVLIPLLSLGGCYTQIALRDYPSRDARYEEDQYAYEDQADTTYYDDNFDNDYDYSYHGYNRRYLWSYYPSFGFSLGYYDYYPYNYRYSLFGWDNPFWYWNYYSPWYYGYYPYWRYSWPYYYGNNYPWVINQANVKYRDIYTRTRDNDGLRGRDDRGRLGGGGERGRPNSSVSARDRNNNPNNVDLGRVRVSRDGSSRSEGTRVSKDTPRTSNSSGENARTRNQGVRDNRNSAPQSRDRDATRGRGESSYQPTSRERTPSTYNPPSSSYSPRSDGGSRSSGNSSGGSRSSGSDGGRSSSSGSDGGRKR